MLDEEDEKKEIFMKSVRGNKPSIADLEQEE